MQVQVRLLSDDANVKEICLLPGNQQDEIILDWRPSASLYHSASLETVVLTIDHFSRSHGMLIEK